jgi:hypothetical protein
VSDIDQFASLLLDEAKRFLEKSQESQNDAATNANLHAALMLGFSALEAHTNAIGDDFVLRQDLTPHDRGVLEEKEAIVYFTTPDDLTHKMLILRRSSQFRDFATLAAG